jgi:hypothetical protein
MDLKNIPSFDADLLNNIGQKKLTLFAIGFFLITAISWNAFLYLGYEGGWNLFARALNNGASIHDDLHYLLPNFYPEFFRFSLNIFGNDIAMKIISILLFFLIQQKLVIFFYAGGLSVLTVDLKNFYFGVSL